MPEYVETAAGRRYRQEMDRLVLLAATLRGLDLAWLLATIDRADALGPVVYPTAWHASTLDDQRCLVAAAISLRDALPAEVDR
jgi:hypothetical protein